MIVYVSFGLAIVSLVGMIFNKLELVAIGMIANIALLLYTFGYTQAEIRMRLDNIEAIKAETTAAKAERELICE